VLKSEWITAGLSSTICEQGWGLL